MNRRGFLGALAALVAAPSALLSVSEVEAVQQSKGDPTASGVLLARATEDIKPHSLVVWDERDWSSRASSADAACFDRKRLIVRGKWRRIASGVRGSSSAAIT